MIEDVVVFVVKEIGQGAAEFATNRFRRRWGWQGCLILFLMLAGIIATAIWLLV